MAYIQSQARDQTSLFPVSLEDLIPEDHLVRVIDAFVAKLDLIRLGFDKGYPKAQAAPLTIRQISSSSICTAISSVSAHPVVSKPNASATSKSCGYSTASNPISRPLPTFVRTTNKRSVQRVGSSFSSAVRSV